MHQRHVTVEGCDTFENTSYLDREPARLRLHWLNTKSPDGEEVEDDDDADVNGDGGGEGGQWSRRLSMGTVADELVKQTSPMVARMWSLLSADSYKTALAFVGASSLF